MPNRNNIEVVLVFTNLLVLYWIDSWNRLKLLASFLLSGFDHFWSQIKVCASVFCVCACGWVGTHKVCVCVWYAQKCVCACMQGGEKERKREEIWKEMEISTFLVEKIEIKLESSWSVCGHSCVAQIRLIQKPTRNEPQEVIFCMT